MEIFPDKIAYRSRMIEKFSANQVVTSGGQVHTNVIWAAPLRTYDVLIAVRQLIDNGDVSGLETLKAFWLANGFNAFLFKDWSDFRSNSVGALPIWVDQVLTGQAGDGTSKQFQLTKTYTFGASGFLRNVTRPVQGELKFGWSGTEKTETTDWVADYDTGLVTATVPDTVVPSWGGEFLVPCQFQLTQKNFFTFDFIYQQHLSGDTSFLVIEDKRG